MTLIYIYNWTKTEIINNGYLRQTPSMRQKSSFEYRMKLWMSIPEEHKKLICSQLWGLNSYSSHQGSQVFDIFCNLEMVTILSKETFLYLLIINLFWMLHYISG